MRVLLRLVRSARVAMLVVGLAPLAMGSSGCKQGEGDRCETTEDCSGDLVCESSAAGSGDMICRRPGTPGAPRPDAAGAPADAALGPTAPVDARPAADVPVIPTAPADGGREPVDGAAPDARPASDGAAAADGAAGG